MTNSVYLRILGPLRAWRANAEMDTGPRQQRCLLALLLAREGHPVSMYELIELLWGADPPPSAVNAVHKYVGVLRRLLEPGLPPRAAGTYLTRHGNAYRFTAGPETLDLVAFRRLAAEAKACARRGEFAEALDRYAEALRLGHGPAGDGLGETPAARAVFANLDGEFLDTVLAAADVAVRLRRPAQMLASLRRAAELDPLNEPVQTSLVTTLAAAGQQAEALVAYWSTRERLADELGIDPGPDLQEAYRRVMTQTVLPLGDAAPSGPPVRPAQLPPDLPLFTGRVAELATLGRLTSRLHDGGRTGPLVIAMNGLGGAGKSALAVRFAHQVAGGFTDGQLYLDLRGNQPDEEGLSASDALRSLLHGLGARTPDVPDMFDARVGMYRTLTAGKRFLILLDNARDDAQVRTLLPNSAGSLVLLTSRWPLLDLAARYGARLIRVDVSDPRTGRAECRLAPLLCDIRRPPSQRSTKSPLIVQWGRLISPSE